MRLNLYDKCLKMKFSETHSGHLTYCSNIHPGEKWEDHFGQLRTYLPGIKRKVSPDQPFGTGLRLSAKAANELIRPDVLEAFKNWLKQEDLYLFAINGFPYGSFHGERVKENVYAPDWSDERRLKYTLNLADILSELIPDYVDGGISTSPVSYKYWFDSEADCTDVMLKSVEKFSDVAWHLSQIENQKNRYIHLDIEPEPDCLLENGIETVSFFKQWLLPEGSNYLQRKHQLNKKDAREMLLRYIQVCYDTCHFAVEFEDPEQIINMFVSEGIGIGRTQISSALKVPLGDDPKRRETLKKHLTRFNEPVYLHQVVELRSDESYRQYRDLDQALKHIDNPEAVEWRIHFHVPVFLDRFGDLQSTRDHIKDSLPLIFEKTGCRHFEVETYTWDVLPDELKTDIGDSIVRELDWVLKEMQY